MKNLIFMMFLALSVNAKAELSNFIDITGSQIAAVAWDQKGCSISSDTSGGEIFCPTPEGNVFYSPTVLIFNKNTGSIANSIKFFDAECPYSPLNLSLNKQELTLIAQITPPLLVGIDELYPNCEYPPPSTVVTFRETRDIKTGKLISSIELQDYRSATLP